MKRELSGTTTTKSKKGGDKRVKMNLRSELLLKSLREGSVKPKLNYPLSSSTTITNNTSPTTATSTIVSTVPTTIDPKKWKVQDEVSVLWMNGEYKEAIIVGAPNKGDAFLVKLVEDEDQMYTIKAERILPRSYSQTTASSTSSTSQSTTTMTTATESEFTLDEFHIYEADTPFSTTTTRATPANDTRTTTISHDKEAPKPVEPEPEPVKIVEASITKPNNLSELSDLEDDNETKWDYEEEGRLLISIEKFGFNWEKVSDYVASKSTCECRDRWKYHARMLSEFVHQPISD